MEPTNTKTESSDVFQEAYCDSCDFKIDGILAGVVGTEHAATDAGHKVYLKTVTTTILSVISRPVE